MNGRARTSQFVENQEGEEGLGQWDECKAKAQPECELSILVYHYATNLMVNKHMLCQFIAKVVFLIDEPSGVSIHSFKQLMAKVEAAKIVLHWI